MVQLKVFRQPLHPEPRLLAFGVLPSVAVEDEEEPLARVRGVQFRPYVDYFTMEGKEWQRAPKSRFRTDFGAIFQAQSPLDAF